MRSSSLEEWFLRCLARRTVAEGSVPLAFVRRFRDRHVAAACTASADEDCGVGLAARIYSDACCYTDVHK